MVRICTTLHMWDESSPHNAYKPNCSCYSWRWSSLRLLTFLMKLVQCKYIWTFNSWQQFNYAHTHMYLQKHMQGHRGTLAWLSFCRKNFLRTLACLEFSCLFEFGIWMFHGEILSILGIFSTKRYREVGGVRLLLYIIIIIVF